MKRIIILLCIFSANVCGKEVDLGDVFSRYAIEGAIVVENIEGSARYVHNKDRAQTKFAVGSTFKIPNTLIGIEKGAVSGKSAIFRWDGVSRSVDAWNKDQTLASAFRVSCVWCYQLVATKVGIESYKTYIRSMGYGKLPDGFDVQNFWLDGSLKISAFEQVEFLKKVYQRRLPFGKRAFIELEQVMRLEKSSKYSFYAKTGWVVNDASSAGWYVGYLDGPKGVWFFAANLDVKNIVNLHLREKITMEVLVAIGIIPGG